MLRLLSRFLFPAAALSALPAAPLAANQPVYLDPAQPVEARIEDALARMTIEEKVAWVHANGMFTCGGVPRLGLPKLWMADGPQGVREEVGVASWEPAGRTDDFATAMPVPIALAATWDPALAREYGRVVGEEARARGKHVMLAPGVNIMRSPLCGRNYDYFGEDPWLAARLAVGYVEGMQGEDVVACIKHYAANNQEKDRGTIDVRMDERTLREIYLPAFEYAVREARVLGVMGAYNKFRGQHCCHHDYLLNAVLKREWGFAGAVISDWGGTHDTREAVLHGLDIEMGGRRGFDDFHLARPFRAGLADGTYPVAALDDKVRRVLRLLYAARAVDGPRHGSINTREHQAMARRIAADGIVLLKNEGALLPLDLTKIRSIAVIGDNAVRKFAAGGNAAGVKAFYEITALEGITARAGARATITFAQGYRQPMRVYRDGRNDAGVRQSVEDGKPSPAEIEELAARAEKAAREADVVVFVAGLTHQAGGDDEGADRASLGLPAGQDALIARIAAANPRTVVVMIAGSPIAMEPWIEAVPAVVQAWYGGTEAGHALAAVLCGDTNPSGRLPCSFPRRLEDSAAHAAGAARQWPGENGAVHYDEGVLVGYRWHDAREIAPRFPFGFGLSYTTFSLANLRVAPAADGTAAATVTCEVTNTGRRAGAEVVQVYVGDPQSSVARPPRELKGFAKVSLQPGETNTVTIELGPRAFAFFGEAQRAWVAEAGEFVIHAGTSSRDLPLRATFSLAQTRVLP